MDRFRVQSELTGSKRLSAQAPFGAGGGGGMRVAFIVVSPVRLILSVAEEPEFSHL